MIIEIILYWKGKHQNVIRKVRYVYFFSSFYEFEQSVTCPSHASPQPLTAVMASITPTLGLMSVDTMLLEDIAISQTNLPTVSEEELDFIEEAESSPPTPYDYSPQVDTALTLKTSSPVKSETKETTTPPMKRLPGGSSTTISTRTMMTTRSS